MPHTDTVVLADFSLMCTYSAGIVHIPEPEALPSA
jgi:hypothetical protein